MVLSTLELSFLAALASVLSFLAGFGGDLTNGFCKTGMMISFGKFVEILEAALAKPPKIMGVACGGMGP